MVRKQFPHVNVRVERRKDGTVRRAYYYRPTGARLPDLDDPDFARAYRDEAGKTPARAEPVTRTLVDLITLYKVAPEFTELAPKSRKDYERYLVQLRDLIGDIQVSTFERRHVFALRDRFAAKPRTANYIVQIFRLLMTFAVDRGWRKDNPALRPKMLATGDGWRAWTDEEIERFRASAPDYLRTPFELALHTGQREGDVLAMTRGHLSGGGIRVKQEKTGAVVWIPLHPALSAYLATVPKDRFLFCVTTTGAEMKADHFRHRFLTAMKAASVSGVVFHGLRATAATRLAEAGCSDAEIQAITGHRNVAMVQRYRRGAAQKTLATAAISRLNATPRTVEEPTDGG